MSILSQAKSHVPGTLLVAFEDKKRYYCTVSRVTVTLNRNEKKKRIFRVDRKLHKNSRKQKSPPKGLIHVLSLSLVPNTHFFSNPNNLVGLLVFSGFFFSLRSDFFFLSKGS